MAVNLSQLFQKHEAALIDPLNGTNDIKHRLIRMSSSHVFADDPVRLIRAFRLSALYGLQIEEGTKEKIKNESCRLKSSSWERIRDEFFSILETNKACHHIQELSASGILQQILSAGTNKGSQRVNNFTILTEIENLFDDASVFSVSLKGELILYFREASGGISKLALLKFSALMYDSLGLLISKDRPASAAEHLTIVKRLKLSNKAQRLLINAWQNLSNASYLLTAPEIKSSDCYTLFRESGKDGIFNIFLAFGILKSGSNIDNNGTPRLGMIIAYFFDQYLKMVEAPILSGSDIMDTFDVSQGKKVGEILQIVEQARAEGLIGSKREAIEYIKEYLE
jgi:tRNA nucleotidyltransferase/poly(A) polymerase